MSIVIIILLAAVIVIFGCRLGEQWHLKSHQWRRIGWYAFGLLCLLLVGLWLSGQSGNEIAAYAFGIAIMLVLLLMLLLGLGLLIGKAIQKFKG